MLFQTIQLQLKRGGIVTENQVLLSRFKSIDIVAQKQCNCPLKTMLLAGKVITFALQLAIFLKINKLAMPNNRRKSVLL